MYYRSNVIFFVNLRIEKNKNVENMFDISPFCNMTFTTILTDEN